MTQRGTAPGSKGYAQTHSVDWQTSPPSKLVKIGFANNDGTGPLQPDSSRSVLIRDLISKHFTSSRGAQTLEANVVLDPNRNAV